MKAIEVVTEIVRINPEIKHLEFYAYSPRLNVSELQEPLFLSRLLFHDNPQTYLRSREKITVVNLKKKISSLKEGSVLSVLSRVKQKNRTFHIPMMDFSCQDYFGKKVSLEQNLSDINCFLREEGYNRGAILFSGRSFHYYGTTLITEEQWQAFLGDCLLSGLADRRFIGHRLKDKCSSLRLSACPLRPKIPKVVMVLE